MLVYKGGNSCKPISAATRQNGLKLRKLLNLKEGNVVYEDANHQKKNSDWTPREGTEEREVEGQGMRRCLRILCSERVANVEYCVLVCVYVLCAYVMVYLSFMQYVLHARVAQHATQPALRFDAAA